MDIPFAAVRGDAIQIDMRDLSSSCTTEPERGGMRNSTRYDLDTTLVRPWCSIPQCFVGCKRKSKNTTLVRPWHRYDLGTTLVRPWYDLGTTATRHVYMYDCHLIGGPLYTLYIITTVLRSYRGHSQYRIQERQCTQLLWGRPAQEAQAKGNPLAIHRAWSASRRGRYIYNTTLLDDCSYDRIYVLSTCHGRRNP